MLLCLWTAFLFNHRAATETELVMYGGIKTAIALRLNLENIKRLTKKIQPISGDNSLPAFMGTTQRRDAARVQTAADVVVYTGARRRRLSALCHGLIRQKNSNL